jgi:Zn finger protein HypA/HybF involved in hydrogenase expression
MVIDNFALWEAQDREEQERLDRLPLCECCNQPIQQEKAVYYNDQFFCEDCESEAWEAIREDFLESTTD